MAYYETRGLSHLPRPNGDGRRNGGIRTGVGRQDDSNYNYNYNYNYN
jgi:hypothetical protein